MRMLTALVVLASILFPALPAQAIKISYDPGGHIGIYKFKYERLWRTGEPVVIDGLCASACTLVLALPKEQVCATSRAQLKFHQAFDIDIANVNGRQISRPVPNRDATELLFDSYPAPVREWIRNHGGLPPPPPSPLLVLKGRELAKFVPHCVSPGTLPPLY